MAVPRNRTSNARKNSRRAHHAKQPKCLNVCKKCNTFTLPHTVCTACGVYDGKVVAEKK